MQRVARGGERGSPLASTQSLHLNDSFRSFSWSQTEEIKLKEISVCPRGWVYEPKDVWILPIGKGGGSQLCLATHRGQWAKTKTASIVPLWTPLTHIPRLYKMLSGPHIKEHKVGSARRQHTINCNLSFHTDNTSIGPNVCWPTGHCSVCQVAILPYLVELNPRAVKPCSGKEHI